jgi:phosphomannomutase/phosphoglucomutase
MAPLNPQIFREYDVRGLVGRDLHRDAVVLLGKGYATLAALVGVRTVALGRDIRLSSPGFRDAIAEGLLSAGLKVIDVGGCPTPLR